MKALILEKLQLKHSESIRSSGEFAGDLLVTISKESLISIGEFLRDDPDLQFDSLRDAVGIDQYRPEGRFEVVYNLYSLKNKQRLFLKVSIEESDAVCPSLTCIWPGADWCEREVFDMLGIKFDKHPDLRRIYMPEEFEYYPLRKEFPLMGIPGSLPLPPK